MNRTLKAIIVAVALIVAGSILAGCSLWGMGSLWENVNVSPEVVTVQDTIAQEFTHIDAELKDADLTLLPSPDNTCYYIATTYKDMPCTVTVENGTLKIRQGDDRQWHQHVGIVWEETSLQVYLPETVYGQLTVTGNTSDVDIPHNFTLESANIVTDTGDVKLGCQVNGQVNVATDTGDITVQNTASQAINAATDTGSIHLDGVTCDSISVSTDTGFIRIGQAQVAQLLSATSTTGSKALTDVKCGSLKIESTTGDNTLRNVAVSGNAKLESDTGDWELENVIASGDAQLDSTTGDWEFDGFDAANITMQTNTGDVEGTLLSDKIFFADSDTGNVKVPRTTTGGTCQINTDTGDIELDIVP